MRYEGGGFRALWCVFLISALSFLFSACESTQQKSERLGRAGKGTSLAAKGLVVSRQSTDVKVIETDALQDSNGTAAVVALRNTSKRALAEVPIAIDVRDAGGKSLFRNDAPGLEPTLVKAPLLRPGERFLWVNDQVSASTKPHSLKVKVGETATPSPAHVPRIELTAPRLEHDSVSGSEAIGMVANHSRVEQRKLVVFAVARRAGKVVAAGRAQINRLQPGKRARFHVFFIGNPSGARITVAAPPTELH
jgi:hypothetical protein